MQVVIESVRLKKFIDLISKDFSNVEFIFDDGISKYENAKIAFGWVNQSLFHRMPNLEWIQSDSSGVDWLTKVPELANSDILVTNTRGAQADSVAEHGIAMLLYHTRRIHDFIRLQTLRSWIVPNTLNLRSLRGLKIGIYGFGAIGQALAKRASAFGMMVTAIDPRPSTMDSFTCMELDTNNLEVLVENCDVLAITAPLTEETRHAIGEKELALMKSDAIILVLSRGGIIDEQCLIRFVVAGKFSWILLDCLENEPPDFDDPIFSLPRTFITPHCATISEQTQMAIVEIMKTNLERFLTNTPLINLVDKQRGY